MKRLLVLALVLGYWYGKRSVYPRRRG